VKQTMIAALAALMIAGALSAVSGATPIGSLTPVVVVVGEGSAPVPTTLPAFMDDSDSTSGPNNF